MKRVFSVALSLGLLVLGISAIADNKVGEKATAAGTAATGKAMSIVQPHESHIVKMSQLEWKDMDGYPAGCKMAGVCTEGGITAGYGKFPAGTKVAAHTHPSIHWGTVISGTGTMGFGTDPTKGIEISAGDYIHIPANAVHWFNTKSDAVLYISMLGPIGIQYANASDDPRKGQAGSEEHPK